MTYTREQYLNKECNHRQFYAQFVTSEIKSEVEQAFGYSLRNYPHDEHLNDISLPVWDRMAYGIKLDGCDNSLASKVCTLKEAAKQLIEESKATQRCDHNEMVRDPVGKYGYWMCAKCFRPYGKP